MARFRKWVRARFTLPKATKQEYIATADAVQLPHPEVSNSVAKNKATSTAQLFPVRRKTSRADRNAAKQLINEHGNSSQKALLWAIQYGNNRDVTLLLEHGINDARPDSFRRCLCFAIRRDDSELLLQLLPTAQERDLLTTILTNVPFLRLFAKSSDAAIVSAYLAGLSPESQEEIMMSATQRGDLDLLARILPLIKDDNLRSSFLQTDEFVQLTSKDCNSHAVNLLMQKLDRKDQERVHRKSTDLYYEFTAKGRQVWPDRVEQDPKTREWVKTTPMEPSYWN